jgi:rfaE bifunctional protein nucleotidyltransferase chain/domain
MFISIDDLRGWRDDLDPSKKLVVTNGCFDLLHAGHVDYLKKAAALGDMLLVGCDSDASVRQLKGSDRPINPENDRAAVLDALRAVDIVTVFPEKGGREFIASSRPHIYTKGGDYSVESLNICERSALKMVGAEIRILPFTEGRSTSLIINRLREGRR